MLAPDVSRSVRLLQDIPELGLRRGAVGVICSTWCDPQTAYEVEFQPDGIDYSTRTLLMANQIDEAVSFESR